MPSQEGPAGAREEEVRNCSGAPELRSKQRTVPKLQGIDPPNYRVPSPTVGTVK